MRRKASWAGLFVGVLFLAACTSHHYHPYPVDPYARASKATPEQASPAASDEKRREAAAEETVCWPELILSGGHPTKVELVRAEFIHMGWNPNRIRTDLAGEPDKVRATVSRYGYVDIPTSDRVLDRGLCSTQKAAIHGIVYSSGCQ